MERLVRQAGAVAFLIMAMLLVAHAGPAQARNCPDPLLAMTYNIRLDTPADGQNAWPFRRDFLLAQILVLRPAILGMQEVMPNQRSDLERQLPGYAFIGGGRDDGKLAGEASPIAIDRRIFRIQESGTFWLSPTPEHPSRGWDAAYPRIASWARLSRRTDRATLLVVNTHWDHESRLARDNSGKLLASWILHNRRPADEVLLLGDFNAVATDPAFQFLLTPKAGLRDSREAAERGTAGPNFSFNAFSALAQDGRLIDHLFVSAGLRIIQHMIISEHDQGKVPSDHYPVVALFTLGSGLDRPACR